MERPMKRTTPGRLALSLLFLASAFPWPVRGAETRTFAFVDSRYAITAEIASEHKFVVNFINLSDFVVVLQPNEFIYKGASGRFYIGQVFEMETRDVRGELQRYSASYLLKGRSFAGLTIAGAFREKDRIEELSVRIGAKRYYLQAVEAAEFEQLAAKISGIDLEASNPSEALSEANIPALGTLRSTDGTSDWDRDWQGLITADGINPPKILERPEIEPPETIRKSKTYGKVRISALINRSGGIQDLKVVKGLEKNLDKRALEGVRNSWLFLPATKNGEVTDASVILEVVFAPPGSKISER